MTKEEAIEALRILEHIQEYMKAEKILSTFIQPFYNSATKRKKQSYLHGSFNLGGTKSGRLSSSNPNLTNLPATGTKYAKLIKKCFTTTTKNETVPEWLFVGADFDSLEDKISALTTGDQNKQKVYTDGFDGHSLRAYAYFKDQMPDIAQQMNNLKKPNKFYQIINDDGTVEYTYENT